MTPRQRVLTALDHREPDRVPIDLGSCGPTGIHVWACERLHKVLGLVEKIKTWDVVGQLAAPSETVLDLVRADGRGVRVGGSYTPELLSKTEKPSQHLQSCSIFSIGAYAIDRSATICCWRRKATARRVSPLLASRRSQFTIWRLV